MTARSGRVVAAVSSTAVTVVALLGGAGVLPTSAVGPVASVALAPAPEPVTFTRTDVAGVPARQMERPAVAPAVPARSGTGRRIVFSESRQRVWLVRADGAVRRTYLVSGSLYDNLDPGTYQVFSKSEQAWGYDDTGTMEWFVRFTQTESGGNIGFHDIPVDEGRAVQSVAQLGTPRSHGCIRQREKDARALWRFAPIGTTVVVTA